MQGNSDPIDQARSMLDAVEEQRRDLIRRSTRQPDGLLLTEAALPLTINGVTAAQFIKRAYDLGADCKGPGRYDMHDPVQTALRNVKGWIEMAERDSLDARTARESL